MDWRAFIFPDPAAQMYVANETSANLEEQEFFRNTLTPEIILPEELRLKALKPLKRMMELS